MPLIGGFRSMKVEQDAVYQTSAPAAHATLYTVTDCTGAGILSVVAEYNSGGAANNYVTIAIDGGTTEVMNANAETNLTTLISLGVVNSGWWHFAAEFNASLLVKMANNHGATAYNLTGLCLYQHLSNEVKREIIPAGEPLPNRDYTYPFDVLVVHYATGGTSIKFLSSEQVKTWTDPDGTVRGQLVKPAYNLEALGIAGETYDPAVPKIVAAPVHETKEVEVELSDLEGYPGRHVFRVPIVDGMLDNKNLPIKPVYRREE